MYCALDKIDLAATVEGRKVSVQTDHRSVDEIEREPELSVLIALARVINARQDSEQVYYIVEQAPMRVFEALAAAGAMVAANATQLPAGSVTGSDELVDELCDHAFTELAQRAARGVGTRDVAFALRMLEDQTLADPPRRDRPQAYWRRILELAALTGEVLRAKFAGARWVVSERALVPFGLSLPLTGGNATTLFPTNRAKRLIDEGRDHSLFGLISAAEEAPLDHGRLMPSLRLRAHVELDELVWRSLMPEVHGELPIVVCGIDGDNVFGMIRRDDLSSADDAWTEALANLAAEKVELARVNEPIPMIAVSGSFYAAEKLLDRTQLLALHGHLDSAILLAATPARGGLLVARNADASRFASIVRARYDAAGSRAISPVVWIVEDGELAGRLPS